MHIRAVKQAMFLLWALSIVSCSEKQTAHYLEFVPQRTDIGTVESMIDHVVSIHVKNNGNKGALHILGISESCSCVYDSIKLPLTIEPGQETNVHFIFNNHDTARHGNFVQKVVFHTDSDSAFQTIEIAGQIR